jgi:hypothetical protein
MWIELGIFAIVLVFGLWQIHDVGLERRKTQARKQAAASEKPVEVDLPKGNAEVDH